MEPKGDLQHLELIIPSRGIIGLRNNVLTATGGEAIMAHRFKAYEPWKGTIPGRLNGVLVSMDTGKTTAFAIDKLQDRGRFHIDPGTDVYEGQVLGEHIRDNDLVINLTKGKQLTNMRASNVEVLTLGSRQLSNSRWRINGIYPGDEYRVTPQSIRMRRIFLKNELG